MLQARCLSPPVNGRSHFKKFWLRKLEKEEKLIEALDMSSPSVIVSQQPHQQMYASLSSCDYRKFIAQSPAYSSMPITGSTNLARTQSVASTAIKFGSIAPSHVQLLTGSTSGTENSDKSLVSRTTAFNVVHIGPVEDEEAARSLNTVRVECAMINRHDENHKDCSTIDCTRSLSADKINVGRIPPRHSRSGSPVLATSGPNDSSKILLQSPGLISLHSNLSSSFDGGDESKQDLETDFTDNVDCKSVRLVPASTLDPLQETWNDDLLPNSFDEIVVKVTGRNAQLCSAFQPVENSSKSLRVMSTSNQGNALTACASTSFRSAVTGLHHKIMHSDVGTDGWTDKMLEHRSSLPVLDSASGSNPCESSEQNPDADNSRKLFCSESWNARSPSKESDYNDKSEKASGCRQTSLFSRHLSSMNEFAYSFPSPNSNQQFPEGGSTRNSTRTCSHCGTMKTPLWRSGPLGPKSLCNACGIRLKKAGRRIAIRDSTDNSVSRISSPKSAAKLTSKPLKRKLEKPNSFPVDSWFARARLKAAHNHTPKLHLSEKTKMFSAQLRKVQAGEVFCEKAGSINMKNHLSSPSTSLGRTSSACTHESPVIYNDGMPASDARKHAVAMARLEFERFDTANPISLRRSFSKDEEEGAVLLMALSYGLVNA